MLISTAGAHVCPFVFGAQGCVCDRLSRAPQRRLWDGAGCVTESFRTVWEHLLAKAVPTFS